MDARRIEVRMLGGFSIRMGNRTVDSGGNRSHKVWLLLAYLIWNRGRQISEEELTGLLWGEAARNGGLSNALKTILHRARSALDGLGEGCGRLLILRREGDLLWNEEAPLTLDAEEFAQEKEPASLKEALERLALYQGSFLPQLAEPAWPTAIRQNLRRRYLALVFSVLPRLREENRWEEIAGLCRAAAGEAPVEEEVYKYWMTALLALEKRREAAAVYEALRDRLLASSGVMPGQEVRALYREALRQEGGDLLTLDQVMDQIREDPGPGGAYFCEYDFFQAVCQAAARDMIRSGQPAHLALFTLEEWEGRGKKPLPRHSLDRAADHLREVIRSQLRRGDVAAACGAAQFAVLLPRANYDNGQIAVRRILRTFSRQYPHAPVRPRVELCPLLSGESPG